MPVEPTLCAVCGCWARTESNERIVPDHHPDCPRKPENVMLVLGALVQAVEQWAKEEDGVPDFAEEAYDRAKAAVN